jgi:hypothetical protein
VHESAREAKEIVEEAVHDAISDDLDGVEEIKADAEVVYERYRARLEALSAEMDAELEPMNDRLETVQRAVREKLEALELDLPPVPEPDLEDDPEDEGWLFDSRRNYLEQLLHYKAR